MLMESVQPQQTLHQYARAYQQVYKALPRELRIIGDGWVCVNGARMRVVELEYLAQQLEFEHQQHLQREERRSVVQRLIRWFTK